MSAYIDFDRHKKILGTLFVVFSVLNIAFIFFGTMVLSELIPIYVPDENVLLILRIVKYGLWTIAGIITIPGIIAGIGLLYKKDWALIVAFVLGIIALPCFPIWTFIGIYTIIIFILKQRDEPNLKSEESNH